MCRDTKEFISQSRYHQLSHHVSFHLAAASHPALARIATLSGWLPFWIFLLIACLMPDNPPPVRQRLASLDQFRGYTVVGMLLVNFLGGFQVCPRVLRHTHDYCSYADTIMPQFLFAAGFALRLGAARLAQADRATRWKRIARRFIGLSLVSIIWYSFCDWGGIRARLETEGLLATIAVATKRTWFQTLLHIAVTSLWITPVMNRTAGVRVAFALGSGMLHVWLSWLFNFSWVNGAHGVPTGIDGGPLGFLTWTTTAIAGTLACDLLRSGSTGIIRKLALSGIAVAGLAYAMSSATTLYNVPAADPQTSALPDWFGPADSKLAIDPVVPVSERRNSSRWTLPEPPFVPPPDSKQRQWNYWMMSQRAGTWSYTMFCAGTSLIVLAFFYWFSDRQGWQMGIFRTLGTNALAAYIFHDIAGWIIEWGHAQWPKWSQALPALQSLGNVPLEQRDSSAGLATVEFLIFFALVYGACRVLEKLQWYVRM